MGSGSPGSVFVELDGYRDFTPVAAGGDSTVYRAFQVGLDRPVAVKILAADLDGGQDRAARFRRELEITVRLGRAHPHIVSVLDTRILPDGRPCIVMEYFDEGSLHDRLRARGPLHSAEVTTIGVVISDALAFAHGQGVLHRDVKPQNILVLPTSFVLADFGLARRADAGHSASLEQFSYRHAAPQVLDGELPAATDDVYSLGSTLFTLLDGRPPFAGDDPDSDAPLAYIRRVRMAPPREIKAKGVPDALKAVIMRCLSKRREDRFPDAASLRDALSVVAAEDRIWAPDSTPTGSQTGPSSRPVAAPPRPAGPPALPPVAPGMPSYPVAAPPRPAGPALPPVAPGMPSYPVAAPPRPADPPAPPSVASGMPSYPAGSSSQPPPGVPTGPPASQLQGPSRPPQGPSTPASDVQSAGRASAPAHQPVFPPEPPEPPEPSEPTMPVDSLGRSMWSIEVAPDLAWADRRSNAVIGGMRPEAPGDMPVPARRRSRLPRLIALIGVSLVLGALLTIAIAWVRGLGTTPVADNGSTSPNPSVAGTGNGTVVPSTGGGTPTAGNPVGPGRVDDPAIAPRITKITDRGNSFEVSWEDRSGGKAVFVVVEVVGTEGVPLSQVGAGKTRTIVEGIDPGRPYCLAVLAVTETSQGISPLQCTGVRSRGPR